jgi:hypothetical protein
MKYNKIERKQNLKNFLDINLILLEEDLEEYELSFDQISQYQFRFFSKNRTFDIYPSSKKYFDLETKQWGQYNGKHKKFIKNYIIKSNK